MYNNSTYQTNSIAQHSLNTASNDLLAGIGPAERPETVTVDYRESRDPKVKEQTKWLKIIDGAISCEHFTNHHVMFPDFTANHRLVLCDEQQQRQRQTTGQHRHSTDVTVWTLWLRYLFLRARNPRYPREPLDPRDQLVLRESPGPRGSTGQLGDKGDVGKPGAKDLQARRDLQGPQEGQGAPGPRDLLGHWDLKGPQAQRVHEEPKVT
ncbi:hypothetical protein OS493_018598 [Desmophyllum pertusum]|uniref:Uncharacterized protein n=1 Tax=Desmophyllum pertusum TaxID=174260 RepID=A0A9X0D370_9CNID|nr:hypothetical protein OS493_018598 [Desmophyllum pertusum]